MTLHQKLEAIRALIIWHSKTLKQNAKEHHAKIDKAITTLSFEYDIPSSELSDLRKLNDELLNN